MNLKQIFKALVDGKKIRKKSWSEDSDFYFALNKDGTRIINSCDSFNQFLDDLYEPDWEIYSGEKKFRNLEVGQKFKKNAKQYEKIDQVKYVNSDYIVIKKNAKDKHGFLVYFAPYEKVELV